MRRIAVIALLVLPVVALVVGWLIWMRLPALVVSPRALPEVAKVEYTGSANAALVVVHFLDWHFVPPDLCKLDGNMYVWKDRDGIIVATWDLATAGWADPMNRWTYHVDSWHGEKLPPSPGPLVGNIDGMMELANR
jgi:hypothetical protein